MPLAAMSMYEGVFGVNPEDIFIIPLIKFKDAMNTINVMRLFFLWLLQ
ncbi:hypothetical protein [Floridanema aerugineum]